MASLPHDPRSWEICDVLFWIRHRLQQTAARIPHARLPDLEALATAFEEQEIAGFALLKHVDADFLKNDCNVRIHGQRATVLEAIDHLREHTKTLPALPLGDSPRNGASESQNAIRPPTPEADDDLRATSLSHHSAVNHGSTRASTASYKGFDGDGVRDVNTVSTAPEPTSKRRLSTVDDQTKSKRRRIQVSTISNAKPADAINHSLSLEFMEPFPIEQVFYRGCKVGEAIPTTDEEDDEIFHHLTAHSGEHRIFVAGQMRHVLQNPRLDSVTYRGVEKLVYMPHRRAWGKTGQRKSDRIVLEIPQKMTVLPEGEDDPSIMLDETVLGAEGEWDFLRTKDDESDEVLSLYRKSDDAFSDVSSQFLRELAESDDGNEGKRIRKRLTADEVQDIIRNIIEDYSSDWQENCRPTLEERQAYKIWREARGQGGKTFKMEVEWLRERLGKMARDLAQHEWQSQSELASMAKILRPTVADMKEAEWKRDVSQRVIAPTKPSKSEPKKAPGQDKSPSPASVHGDPMDMNDFIEQDEPPPVQLRRGSLRSEAASSVNLDEIPDERAAKDQHIPLPGELNESNGSIAQSSSRGTTPLSEIDFQDAATKSDGASTFRSSDASLSSPKPIPRRVSRSPSRRTSYPATNGTVIEISSDSSADLTTPQRKHPLQFRTEDCSRADLEALEFEDLQAEKDRKKLLAKLILTLEPSVKDVIDKFMLDGPDVVRRMGSVVQKALTRRANHVGLASTFSQTKLESYLVKLYACFLLCDQSYWDSALPTDLWDPIDHDTLISWAQFMNVIFPRIIKFFEKGEIVDLDAEDYDDSSEPVPSAKKKRTPRYNKTAAASRTQARSRMVKYEETQAGNSQTYEDIAAVSDDVKETIKINLVKEDSDADILLPQHLVKSLKDHQLDGVRFMWRELTLPKDETPGCVLAQTMGLGKTCQTISFLATLKDAQRAETRKLIPSDLRTLRILILCPPSVLRNWIKEIGMWAHGYFAIRRLDRNGMDQHARYDELRRWAKESNSILLVSYDMFRRYTRLDEADETSEDISEELIEPETVLAPSNKLFRKDLVSMKKILLNTATLVVADEAHTIRNPKASITKAVKEIRAKRRLALTGTPLSNNTLELFSLLDWTSPEFLGDASEFRDRFARPIEEGTYADATYSQKRTSLKKLAILSKETAPKINRADITVLKGAIPPRTEFNLTISLSPLQMRIYERYVGYLNDDHSVPGLTQARLFQWLALLTVLVNHPLAFRRKLAEKAPSASVSNKQTQMEEDPPAADAEITGLDVADAHVSNMGLSQAFIDEMMEAIPEKAMIEHSHVMMLVREILQLAQKAGDQTLIFSQSLPTLDCLGDLVTQMGHSWDRIDGSKNMPKREASMKTFNEGGTEVLLISTKAGGQGTNLQAANRVIIVDFGFNPAWEEQAIGRAYRLGQKKSTFVYRFVAGGTFQEKLYNQKLFKSSLFQRVVDKQNPERVAKKNMQEWLFPPRPLQKGDVSSEAGKDPLVLDSILEQQDKAGKDTLIYAIKTTETLQREGEDAPLDETELKEVEEERSVFRRRRLPFNYATASAALPSTAPAGLNAAASIAGTPINGLNPLPQSTVSASLTGVSQGRQPLDPKPLSTAPQPSVLARPGIDKLPSAASSSRTSATLPSQFVGQVQQSSHAVLDGASATSTQFTTPNRKASSGAADWRSYPATQIANGGSATVQPARPRTSTLSSSDARLRDAAHLQPRPSPSLTQPNRFVTPAQINRNESYRPSSVGNRPQQRSPAHGSSRESYRISNSTRPPSKGLMSGPSFQSPMVSFGPPPGLSTNSPSTSDPTRPGASTPGRNPNSSKSR